MQKNIQDYKLHVLIPLIYEIKFLKLFKETKTKLKSGDEKEWKNVDHLQFLVAVLRGHWGKNSLTIMTTWAKFHLAEMMKEITLKSEDINLCHRYKLCCICYVLLSDDHFVRFIIPGLDKHDLCQYSILACTREKSHEQFTDITPQSNPILVRLSGRFPDDNELPWTELYQNCEYIPECVELVNHQRESWNIANKIVYDGAEHQEFCGFRYTRNHFRLAMGAMSDFVKQKKDKSRLTCYHCSNFNNVDIPDVSMGFIDERIFRNEYQILPGTGISYIESKVIYNRTIAKSCNITDLQLKGLYNNELATNDIF